MKKKVVEVVFVVCMLMLFAVCGHAAEIAESEKCGDNLTWTLDGDTLIISGDGDTYHYNKGSNLPPWYNQKSLIKKIVIEDGVTSIGYCIFDGLENAFQITIPDSVEDIAYNAFDESGAMCDIIFSGENPKYSYKNGLLLNSDGTKLEMAFSMVKGDYTIPEGIEMISAYAFDSNESITKITIPNTVTEIEEYAFRGCANLKTVILSENLLEIEGYTFENCINLESINIPASVTYVSVGIAWNGDAFSGCNGLKNIFVDENNEYYKDIDGALFDKDMTHIYKCPYGRSGTYTIPDGVKYVGYYETSTLRANYRVFGKNITDVTVPASVISLADYGSGNIFVSEDNEKYSDIDGVLFNKEQTKLLCYPSNKSGELTLPDSLISIAYGAFEGTEFYDNEDNWKNGVLYIGNILVEARNVSGKYIIEEETKIIADYAFKNCNDLISVKMPDSLTNIADYTFANCSNLISVKMSDSLTNIGANAFSRCSKLTNVILPEGLETIGEYAFYYCYGLTEITIPGKVKSIGIRAFEGCTGITDVTINEGVTEIEEYMFYKCDSINTITIPQSVTVIGNAAFEVDKLCYQGTMSQWRAVDRDYSISYKSIECRLDPEELTIDIAVDNDIDKAVYSVTVADSASIYDLPRLTLFIAEYDDSGTLLSVKKGTNSEVSNKTITITADLPSSKNYKYMLWDRLEPLMESVTDITN